MNYEQQCKDMYAFFIEEQWTVEEIAEEFCVSEAKAIEMISLGQTLE